MRYCAYFLPHYNQSEPGQQELSLPPSSWFLQAKIQKFQASGSTKTVTIYQLAQCQIPGNVFVTVDVLSEDVILNWYKQGHSAKVKILFLDQMKKIIERLQNAQDGEHDSQYIVGMLVGPPCLHLSNEDWLA
jgi:hypothetical protein